MGGVAEAWQLLGAEMEAQSDVHRAFASALTDEVVKPLRGLVEKQHRVRKQVEGAVDKTGTQNVKVIVDLTDVYLGQFFREPS